MIPESDWLPLSALQHLMFCPRQCALIHIEREWQENILTAKGRLEHERVHQGYQEFRRSKKQISGLRIHSKKMGIQGQLDLLECELVDENGENNLNSFHLKGTWKVYPVEFKHGQPKNNNCDRIQVCAQVMCLEEMLNIQIEEAALFYHRIRKREEVILDHHLRTETILKAAELHQLFNSKKTPLPVFSKKCKACSMYDICMPKRMSQNSKYKHQLFKPMEIE